MAVQLIYNGTQLIWVGKYKFKATSGMPARIEGGIVIPSNQIPADQCLKNAGPVPEGLYVIRLIDKNKFAKDDGTNRCQLKPSKQLQRIPRYFMVGVCEPYWANWGFNRIRFEAYGAKTKNACKPRRGGFYIHDSTKGYSHGCIEVETKFFNILRTYIKKTRARRMFLRVSYKGTSTTYGGTDLP